MSYKSGSWWMLIRDLRSIVLAYQQSKHCFQLWHQLWQQIWIWMRKYPLFLFPIRLLSHTKSNLGRTETLMSSNGSAIHPMNVANQVTCNICQWIVWTDWSLLLVNGMKRLVTLICIYTPLSFTPLWWLQLSILIHHRNNNHHHHRCYAQYPYSLTLKITTIPHLHSHVSPFRCRPLHAPE